MPAWLANRLNRPRPSVLFRVIAWCWSALFEHARCKECTRQRAGTFDPYADYKVRQSGTVESADQREREQPKLETRAPTRTSQQPSRPGQAYPPFEKARRLANKPPWGARTYWTWNDSLYLGGSSKSPEWRARARAAKVRDGYRCVKCGTRDDLETDHIIPLSQGGTNEFENLQTLCHTCHEVKHGRKLNTCGNSNGRSSWPAQRKESY